jgi:AcrR family transcriptional regulator
MTPRTRNFDRTRTLLIEAASRLFASRGYDRTAVENIIQQAGVSKGAFYHHFSSKEEMLDAVTERMTAEAMDVIRPAISDTSGGAVSRLNRFFGASRTWSLAHFGLLKEVLAVLYRDENTRMRRKIEAHTAALSVPLLADIIQQGIDETVFNPPDAEETARLILQLSWVIREANVRTLLESGTSAEARAAMQRRLDVLVEMLERMLGARRGSIERFSVEQSLGSIEAGDPAGAGLEKQAGAP